MWHIFGITYSVFFVQCWLKFKGRSLNPMSKQEEKVTIQGQHQAKFTSEQKCLLYWSVVYSRTDLSHTTAILNSTTISSKKRLNWMWNTLKWTTNVSVILTSLKQDETILTFSTALKWKTEGIEGRNKQTFTILLQAYCYFLEW